MTTPFIVLTSAAYKLLRSSPLQAGSFQMHKSLADDLFVVDRIEIYSDVIVDAKINAEYKALNWSGTPYRGQWARASNDELAILHRYLSRRPRGSVSFSKFKHLVPTVEDPGGNIGLVIVCSDELTNEGVAYGGQEFSAWNIGRDGVSPVSLQVEPETFGPQQLSNQWPAGTLGRNSVGIVGLGSIGSQVAQSLADIGIGRLSLIDPDRLLWHNLIRHRLGPESIGRHKVDALKASLETKSRFYSAEARSEIQAFRLDVVNDFREFIKIFHDLDVVVCCADGIRARRVVSHAAKLLKKHAILACVLADGSVGEVIRIRPGRTFGCLLCQRSALALRGGIDAEADQELSYGGGTTHKAMSAVPTDLNLVADVAAKMTLATVLESFHGAPGQRLPGEQAVIALRSTPTFAEPFNAQRAGGVVWHDMPPSRPNCPTCSLG